MNDIHSQFITAALNALQESTGITGKLASGGRNVDGYVSLQVGDTDLAYACEVKARVDRFTVLDDIKARRTDDKLVLLVCNPLSHALASRCRELDLPFIDTAGNAYLANGAGVLILVTGRKSESALLPASSSTTITPAALRLMFAFLADPSMLNAPYRELSNKVQVATGAMGKVFDVLNERGFIGTAHGGRRMIVSPALLLSEWATGYSSRLRPKLKQFRFTAEDPARIRAWQPEPGTSAWGGEVAADILTGHLKPATYTIYMDMEVTPHALINLVKEYRLRNDPHGEIEVLQTFWSVDHFEQHFPTVPPHLVYADLLGTNDSRNLTVARLISRQIIEHVHNST